MDRTVVKDVLIFRKCLIHWFLSTERYLSNGPHPRRFQFMSLTDRQEEKISIVVNRRKLTAKTENKQTFLIITIIISFRTKLTTDKAGGMILRTKNKRNNLCVIYLARVCQNDGVMSVRGGGVIVGHSGDRIFRDRSLFPLQPM